MTRDEEELLRVVALENVKTIQAARQKAEDELHAKNLELDNLLSRMRATLESTADGILVTDNNWQITDFNQKYIEMWLAPREALPLRDHKSLLEKISQKFSDPDSFLNRINEIFETQPPDSFDVLELENGKIFERFTKIQIVNGTPVGRVWNFRDITERRVTEKRLSAALDEAKVARHQAETASMAKTDFLANMSHEIRTPMNAIIGLSNILAIAKDLPPKLSEYVQTLRMSADSLLSLINDLLDVAKIEARTIELESIPFNLTALVHEVISMMAVRLKEKNLAFSMDAECVENRVFLGDPTRLRQIILNLCSNAVKFTNNGSVHVGITCQNENVDCDKVCIAVKDTGIGIPDDKTASIFEKFVQADTSINRKYGGTGLGLAITKTLVDIMGGTIHVESTLGKGSVFTACIPLQRATDNFELLENKKKQTRKKQISRPGQKPCILIVDDYPPNVLVAAAFLEQFDCEHDVALDGNEALKKVQHNFYDAVMMDVQMHGLNGFDTTRLIRKHESETGKKPLLVIGVTAHALAGDRERCLAAGMDDYLSKPFQPDDLMEKLSKGFKKA